MEILELGTVVLDASHSEPLHAQIYRGVREAVLNGQLSPGIRLPATRRLAAAWKVSRSTVVSAFDQLIAEGYLTGRVGSGTYVNESIPDHLLTIRRVRNNGQQTMLSRRGNQSLPSRERTRLSRRGKKVCDHYVNRRRLMERPQPFRPGIPALGTFPAERWRRITSQIWRRFGRDADLPIDPMGYRPLREAIVAHLRASRGLDCRPEQVVIVSSTQHALTLLGQILLDPGDGVWIEDPGYPRAQAALKSIGAKLVPVPIDSEGLDLTTAVRRNAKARAVYVTPSHQYPLGVTMSLARRLSLLEWARRRNAWILEDDYAAEYRFAGRPLTALQGLDRFNRVIYLGTFSKIFSPALRLGYLVVPSALIAPLEAARSLIDRCPSFIDQAVLARFISDGHFGRHIRTMRTRYAQRQQTLRRAIQEQVPALEIDQSNAGMHAVAWLPRGSDDLHVSRTLAEHAVIAPPLSNFTLRRPNRPALLLGYAGWTVPEIQQGVDRLAERLRGIL